MRTVLAVDQGTTNSKAILVSEGGEVVSRGSAPVGITYPQPGWVEQDPLRLWQSVCEAIQLCIATAPAGSQIEAVAISNQRESVTAWDGETGEPLGPLISWQCRRTAPDCALLIEQGHAAWVLETTGLPLDPMFPGPKVKWLLDRASTGRNVQIGTVDSWLIYRMTAGRQHLCDASNAARSQLFDLKTQQWSDDLCKLFGVSKDALPRVQDSSGEFGSTYGVPGVPDGTPISSAVGDSHAALFGHGAYNIGDGKVTFGTGSSVMTTLPNFVSPRDGITTTVAWRLNGNPTYAFEGNILVSAASLPWMTEMLGLKDVAALVDLASTAEPSGPGFAPAFVGLGAPHWNSDARALFSQINFSTTRAQMARAVTDSIAFQVRDVFSAMQRQNGRDIGSLYVDGGPSQNDFLMQCVADVLEHDIIQTDTPEASALGAAYLAGLSLGIWRDLAEVSRLPRPNKLIKARKEGQVSLKTWNDAIARSTFVPSVAMGE